MLLHTVRAKGLSLIAAGMAPQSNCGGDGTSCGGMAVAAVLVLVKPTSLGTRSHAREVASPVHRPPPREAAANRAVAVMSSLAVQVEALLEPRIGPTSFPPLPVRLMGVRFRGVRLDPMLATYFGPAGGTLSLMGRSGYWRIVLGHHRRLR